MKTNKKFWIAVIQALISAMLWGAGIPLGNIMEHSIKVIPELASLMYFGVAVCSIPSLFLTKVRPWHLKGKDRLYFGLCILIGSILGPLFLLIAINNSLAGSVSMWQNSDLFLTAIIAVSFFKERSNLGTWVAIAIAFCGAALLAVDSGASSVIATVCVVLSCLCWGIDNNTRLALKPSMGPYPLMFWKGLFSGIFNLSITLLVFHWAPCSLQVAMSAALLGVFAIGIAAILGILSSGQLGATQSTLLLGAAPFAGLLLSHFMLKEPITPTQIVAGIIFSIAIAILLYANKDLEQQNK